MIPILTICVDKFNLPANYVFMYFYTFFIMMVLYVASRHPLFNRLTNPSSLFYKDLKPSKGKN